MYCSSNVYPTHCTEVHFSSFLSGGFTTMSLINPPERKLAKRTSVRCRNEGFFKTAFDGANLNILEKRQVAITKIEIRMIFKIHNVLISFEMEYFSCTAFSRNIPMKYSWNIHSTVMTRKDQNISWNPTN